MGAVNGYGVKETLLCLTPGEMFDMWDLYLDDNGKKQKNDEF